jgi:hypothetical protein
MKRPLGCCGQEHNIAIKQEVKRLEKLGYVCEREYEIPLGTGKGHGHRLVVDIRATRANEELLIEVGSLSNVHGNRLQLLKKLRPHAKIVHITQWKNYLNIFDWERAEFEDWKWRNGSAHVDIIRRPDI